MEWNLEHRNILTYGQLVTNEQKKTHSGERMMFIIYVAGKTGQNNEGRLLFYIIYKS